MADVIEMEGAQAQRRAAAERRAEEVTRVRRLMRHPRNAVEEGEDGIPHWVRPPKPSLQNAEIVFREDAWFRDRLAFNAFTEQVEWDGHDLADHDLTEVRLAAAHGYDLQLSAALCFDALTYTARLDAMRYHPVVDYLDGLVWDGRPRLDNLLTDYAGAEPTDLASMLGARFAMAACARVISPGAKVDTVLVLVGPQGIGKSTWLRTLAGDAWFRDTALDLRSKDAFVGLRGAWIYEMAELAAVRPRDAETVKAFLSAQVDHYRPPYARALISQPRQCVFAGTTNEATFLTDPTGARRFWPVTIANAPDLERTEADRDQLWAEAAERVKAGARWWLEAEESAALVKAHEDHQHEDPWSEPIAMWAQERGDEPFSIREVLEGALTMPRDRATRGHEMRIGPLLRALGFSRSRRQAGGQRVYLWSRGGFDA